MSSHVGPSCDCASHPGSCTLAAGSVLWRKDFGAEHALSSIKVDPTDWRHMCLCGAKGSIIVLRLVNLGRDKVDQQTYKVDMSSSKPGDTLRCCFSTTRDLLYVLLPREVGALAHTCTHMHTRTHVQPACLAAWHLSSGQDPENMPWQGIPSKLPALCAASLSPHACITAMYTGGHVGQLLQY